MTDVRRLPVPVVETWEWQMSAACRDVDSSVSFHPDPERGPAGHGREARAQRVCARCPVIDECRRHALTVQEPYGVCGLSAGERTTILDRSCTGGLSARHGRVRHGAP